jgi:hypothetical protein
VTFFDLEVIGATLKVVQIVEVVQSVETVETVQDVQLGKIVRRLKLGET